MSPLEFRIKCALIKGNHCYSSENEWAGIPTLMREEPVEKIVATIVNYLKDEGYVNSEA